MTAQAKRDIQRKLKILEHAEKIGVVGVKHPALRFPRYGYRRMTAQLKRDKVADESLATSLWNGSGDL